MSRNNNFDLTLDTLAPSGSITRPDQYLRVNDDLVIVKGDATCMKVWFDQNAVGDASDAPVNPVAAATTYTTEFTTSGTYYYHLILIDDVNNASAVYNTQSITFDNVAPVLDGQNCFLADQVSHSHSITKSKTVDYQVKWSDASPSSGIASIVISGSCLDAPVNVTPGSGTETGSFSFGNSELDGTKTVTITITDNAGNTDTYDVSIDLDTQVGVPVIHLLKTDGTTALPAYINYEGIKVNLTSTDTDIVKFKIWEGNSEPENWTNVTTTGVALNETISFTLSSGDGLKTINAKVQDDAGGTEVAVAATVTLDKTNPSNVSVTSTGNIISTVTGFDEVTLTLTGSDSNGVSYKLVKGTLITDTLIDSGSSLPASFALNKTSGAMVADGDYTYTLFVEDAAGNVVSDDIIITLDTTAPTASINSISGWHNEAFPVTVTYVEANEVADLYIWKDDAAATTTPIGGAITPSTNPVTIPSNGISGNFTQGTNYLHIKIVDSVGNVGYLHQVFNYDNVAPTVTSVSFSRSTYQTTAASIRINVGADTSGVTHMQVLGDIQNPTASGEWEAYASTRSVVLTAGDGNKTVNVYVKDAAGNISVTAGSATCELDTIIPYANLVLRKADDSADLPHKVNTASFAARVSGYDDDTAVDYAPDTAYIVGDLIKHDGIVYKVTVVISAAENTAWADMEGHIQIGGSPIFYMIYGDCTYDTQAAQGIAYRAVSLYAEATAYNQNDLIFYEGVIYNVDVAISAQDNTSIDAVTKSVDTTWKAYSVDQGVNYKLVDNLVCTSGDGTKTINLRTIDNAGRVSSAATQSFVYDVTAPTVDITTAADYNRISKAHFLRRSNATTEISGKYADEIHFTFTPNEPIVEYKVCAYLDEDQALWQDAEKTIARNPADETPIPSGAGSAGSINCSATGLDSDAAVDVMIKGADYEAALVARGATAGTTADGGHIVVIYVKDANLWSALAIFEE